MTHTDEILIIANQLANVGKKPSIALIKAKLSVQVPLPIIINTLKTWTHDPHFISQIKKDTDAQIIKPEIEVNAQLLGLIEQAVKKELTQITNELEELKKQVKLLSKIKK